MIGFCLVRIELGLEDGNFLNVRALQLLHSDRLLLEIRNSIKAYITTGPYENIMIAVRVIVNTSVMVRWGGGGGSLVFQPYPARKHTVPDPGYRDVLKHYGRKQSGMDFDTSTSVTLSRRNHPVSRGSKRDLGYHGHHAPWSMVHSEIGTRVAKAK